MHGTVTFVRQSHDKLDTSDLDEINGSTVNEYSDEYIYHVLKEIGRASCRERV